MTWQGVSEAECYDNRSVMAQIMRLKDRVRVLEEEGSEEIQHEIELINEQLTILEGKVAGLEEGTAGLAEDVAALESGKADNDVVVKLTGSQTIMDVKTFVRSPIVPTPTANNEAATKKYVDDNDHDYNAGLGISINNDIIEIDQDYADNFVRKTGNSQTISSLLIFNTMPHAPGTPTNANDVVNKQYVDDNAGGGAWTTLPTTDFGSTGLALLFNDTGSQRIAKKDIMIYVGTATSNDNTGVFSQYIPKGTTVPSHFTGFCSTIAGANYYEWIGISLNPNVLLTVEAPTASNVNLTTIRVVGGTNTNVVTKISGSNIDIQPTTTPFDMTGVRSGRINVCIQYR